MQTPIAIIGIGCRFPGAAGPRAFWKLLSEGASAITALPAERHQLGWTPTAAGDPWGGFINGVDRFDAGFFGISREEAIAMDPQHRLLLETAWEALEDAGIIPKSIAASNAGVYVGVASYNYGSLAQRYPDSIDRFTNLGTGGSVAANRISYFLDLHGPSFSVDGACASSLLAVHLACGSIWSGEANVALAGGVNLTLVPGPTLGLSRAGLLSPDGVCRVFDAGANGSVRGEGAGVVVLKPLPQAQADGDPIYAIIRGSAVNQNGRSNGLGGPNRRAQEAVLREAYRSAAVSPGRVQYLETHSTASLIGDATELAAAGALFQQDRTPGDLCAVGSVKPNIGHLEAAAGIAGLIKTALMLKHHRLVPMLHFRQPNPHADLGKLPLRLQTEPAAWPGEQGQCIAGVSASSYGGVNVHLVLGDAPAAEVAPGEAPAAPCVFTLSAKTHSALRDSAAEFSRWLETAPGAALADICCTVNRGRTRFAMRLAAPASDLLQLRASLQNFADGKPGEWNLMQGKERDAEVPPTGGKRIHGLPTYRFQREPYWLPTPRHELSRVPGISAETPVVPPSRTAGADIPLREPCEDGKRGSISVHLQSANVINPAPVCRAVDPTKIVPPRNTVEQRVVALFEQVLKVSPIGIHDSFFELGGQSAQALELFSLVERTFAKTLPLVSFYAAPTPQHLASLVAMDEAATQWKPVVTLNEAGGQAPLFFVPGLGGHAFAMRTFAERLGPDQPICVLHPQGLDPEAVALTSVEEMARVFLTFVRSRQPTGPYRLGGYSFGGSVAFEMACQLEAQGETVTALAILDAYAPGAFRKRSLARRLLSHAKMICSTSQRKQYMALRMGRVWRRLAAVAAGETQEQGQPRPQGAVVDAVRRVTIASQQAWRSYRPRRFGGRVSLFRAADTNPMIAQFSECDPHNGWGPHAAEVDLTLLPCHHLKLFEGASLDIMTGRIGILLRPSESAAGAPLHPGPTQLRVGA